MDLPYTDIPADKSQRVPSGEYQMLPEPPGAEPQEQAQAPAMEAIDQAAALRWAFQYMMPHLFGGNPADQQQM